MKTARLVPVSGTDPFARYALAYTRTWTDASGAVHDREKVQEFHTWDGLTRTAARLGLTLERTQP